MLIIIFLLIPFIPAAILPLAINTIIPGSELNDMGICLERQESLDQTMVLVGKVQGQ